MTPTRRMVMDSRFQLKRSRPEIGKFSMPTASLGSGRRPAAVRACCAPSAAAWRAVSAAERCSASNKACSKVTGAACTAAPASKPAAMTALRMRRQVAPVPPERDQDPAQKKMAMMALHKKPGSSRQATRDVGTPPRVRQRGRQGLIAEDLEGEIHRQRAVWRAGVGGNDRRECLCGLGREPEGQAGEELIEENRGRKVRRRRVVDRLLVAVAMRLAQLRLFGVHPGHLVAVGHAGHADHRHRLRAGRDGAGVGCRRELQTHQHRREQARDPAPVGLVQHHGQSLSACGRGR
mmetsp:Transcript_5427/g.20662  ORF Transcript_5427/g.20662 Transcript_5427/m.20662 type:complete len:292 (-) Transcript_5427:2344-3219(-)